MCCSFGSRNEVTYGNVLSVSLLLPPKLLKHRPFSSPPPAVYHWIFHLRPASSPRPSPFFSRILHYVLFNVLKRLSIRTTMNPTLLKYTSFFFIRRCRFERIWEKIKFNEISNSCGVEKSSGNLNFGWNFLREENGVVENEGIQIELLFCRKVCVLDIFFF